MPIPHTQGKFCPQDDAVGNTTAVAFKLPAHLAMASYTIKAKVEHTFALFWLWNLVAVPHSSDLWI